MALKSTVYKAELAVADMDRGYYADHALTLARHPSETEERLMVRILAFALHADPDLAFGPGLCVEDAPDLWRRDPTGAIRLWIDVGLPDEKWLCKACKRAERVVLLAYGERTAPVWWRQNESSLNGLCNLSVLELPGSERLTELTARSMRLQCTIQEREVWLTDGRHSVHIEPCRWLEARHA